MALIRNEQARTAARSAVVLDLGDLKRQGERLREAARAEAERVVEAAHAERARLVADAAEEGRRAGHDEGLEIGRAEGAEAGRVEAYEEAGRQLATIADAWHEALERFDAEREHLFDRARLDVIRLAVRFAEKIVKRAVETDHAVVEAQLEAVLSILSNRERLVVSVHPDDEQTLRDAMPRLMARFASAAHVELNTDPDLSRGSVVARTDPGAVIDASIETQLERMAAAILPEGLPADPPGPRDDAEDAP